MQETLRLIPGLSKERLEDEIAFLARGGEAFRRALGFYLLDMQDRRVYQDFGCSSVHHYAEARLKLEPRSTRELLRVCRRLEELTELDGAFGRGEIVWSAVREIQRTLLSSWSGRWRT